MKLRAFKWFTPFKDFYNSFKNDQNGFGSRKLSAFYAIVCVSGVITLKYTTPDNLRDVVSIWLLFALLCMGLVTIQQIIQVINGVDKGDNTDPNSNTDQPAPPLP